LGMDAIEGRRELVAARRQMLPYLRLSHDTALTTLRGTDPTSPAPRPTLTPPPPHAQSVEFTAEGPRLLAVPGRWLRADLGRGLRERIAAAVAGPGGRTSRGRPGRHMALLPARVAGLVVGSVSQQMPLHAACPVVVRGPDRRGRRTAVRHRKARSGAGRSVAPGTVGRCRFSQARRLRRAVARLGRVASALHSRLSAANRPRQPGRLTALRPRGTTGPPNYWPGTRASPGAKRGGGTESRCCRCRRGHAGQSSGRRPIGALPDRQEHTSNSARGRRGRGGVAAGAGGDAGRRPRGLGRRKTCRDLNHRQPR
jgi:hypothetical protein